MMPGLTLHDAVEVLADEISQRGLMVWLSDRPIISMTLHEQYPVIYTRWAGFHVWLFYFRSSQRVEIVLEENLSQMEEKARMDISMDWDEFRAGLMLAVAKFIAGIGHKPDRAGQ